MKAILCDLATHKAGKAFSVQHRQLVQPPPGDQRGQRALDTGGESGRNAEGKAALGFAW